MAARDEYHRHSKISSVATGVIAGLGPNGYIAAMHAVAQMPKFALTFLAAETWGRI